MSKHRLRFLFVQSDWVVFLVEIYLSLTHLQHSVFPFLSLPFLSLPFLSPPFLSLPVLFLPFPSAPFLASLFFPGIPFLWRLSPAASVVLSLLLLSSFWLLLSCDALP